MKYLNFVLLVALIALMSLHHSANFEKISIAARVQLSTEVTAGLKQFYDTGECVNFGGNGYEPMMFCPQYPETTETPETE